MVLVLEGRLANLPVRIQSDPGSERICTPRTLAAKGARRRQVVTLASLRSATSSLATFLFTADARLRIGRIIDRLRANYDAFFADFPDDRHLGSPLA